MDVADRHLDLHRRSLFQRRGAAAEQFGIERSFQFMLLLPDAPPNLAVARDRRA
jgi:hypothetical protein